VIAGASGETLSATSGGRVVAVHFRPGDEVTAGQVLVELDTGRLDGEMARQRRTIEAGEAATWHQLAASDLWEGAYAEARGKFAKALALRQAIGDRAGEAASFYQLGVVAWKTGNKAAAANLVALGFCLAQALGLGDTRIYLQNLGGMCGELGYSEEQVSGLLRAAADAHTRDSGRQLLRDAFPE
jgi:multidrug efflux pump subunit AcrA (membrane-fusion protein)